SIINSLSQISKLRVMAGSTVYRYKGKSVDPQAVGAELNVRSLLLGRLVVRGEFLTIQTELVDTSDGSQVSRHRYNMQLRDILKVQEEIANHISENLQVKLLKEGKRRIAKRSTENTDAYKAYLQGRYHWARRTEEGFRKAIQYFERAIQLDPT